jgi:hypothetical protein
VTLEGHKPAQTREHRYSCAFPRGPGAGRPARGSQAALRGKVLVPHLLWAGALFSFPAMLLGFGGRSARVAVVEMR